MLQNISVGPPMVGATELRSTALKPVEKDFKGAVPGTAFSKALEEKIASKEAKLKDPSPPEAREAPKAKKEGTEVAITEDKPTKTMTVRQQAIQDFMDSFESEFKIPPTRLVEAMGQLTDTQLIQSPEDTAESVIDQLGLDESDADKAQAMYASFLIQLSQTPAVAKAPELGAVPASFSHENVQARMASVQSKQDLLSASVDQLNQSFWKNPKIESRNELAASPPLSKGLAQNLEMDEASFANMADRLQESPKLEAAVSPMDKLPPHLQGQMKDTMSPALLAALAARQAEAKANVKAHSNLLENSNLKEEFQQLAEPRISEASLSPESSSLNFETTASFSKDQNEGFSQEFASQNSGGQELLEGSTVSAEGLGEVVSEVATKDSFSQALSGLEGLQATPLKGETLRAQVTLPAAGASSMAVPGQQNDDASVKQVMTQAQYLIKKGGGEMKVEMSPEGMGTIHLKVMLQDGKVNLHMSADTQEAKKTIESSLAELKTSLAAQKLSMENVKVDVISATNTETATQNQTNTNGQGRDQARQFWNQFNENFGSQGRKESFTDMPNLKGYGSQRDPLSPIETSRSQSRKVEGKGTGLNLVA